MFYKVYQTEMSYNYFCEKPRITFVPRIFENLKFKIYALLTAVEITKQVKLLFVCHLGAFF